MVGLLKGVHPVSVYLLIIQVKVTVDQRGKVMSPQQAIKVMSPRQAIRILMLSPCYWMLKAPDRKILVKEYCVAYAVACKGL